MYIAQYYTSTDEEKKKIVAMIELLGCDFRIVENIISVQINDEQTLSKLQRSEHPPYSIQ